ncbi:MAG: SIR2 family protein [Actinomyces ruminicola]|nr:SIR2 family protein [Actinomyces ruminicola]
MTKESFVTLLGAGASVDAGGHTSVGMVDRVASLLQHQNDMAIRRIYEFVVAGCSMRSAWMEAGSANIEDVANAVAALYDRRYNELAPFVSGWHPFVEGLLSKRPTSHRAVDEFASMLQREFVKASGGQTDTISMDWYSYADKILEFSHEQSLIEPALERLRHRLTGLVAQVLCNSINKELVGYLAGLADLPGPFNDTQAVIATLNYDNAVEYALAGRKPPYRDALEGWRPGADIDCNGDGPLLLKLHGSVNWRRHNEHQITREEPGEVVDRPEIIFGGHNKMRTDGPYLPIMWAWRRALARCSTLIVVGYSFSDGHINTLIDEWLSAKRTKGPPRSVHVLTYAYNEASKFEKRLRRAHEGDLSAAWGSDVRVSVRAGVKAKDKVPHLVESLLGEGAL